eukprot:gene9406-109_t
MPKQRQRQKLKRRPQWRQRLRCSNSQSSGSPAAWQTKPPPRSAIGPSTAVSFATASGTANFGQAFAITSAQLCNCFFGQNPHLPHLYHG